MLRWAAALGVIALAGCGGSDAPCSNGYVALTYDDGPSAQSARLLDALRAHDLRATMFVTAKNAAANPEAVKAQAEAGLWIENHTVTHPDLTELVDRQLTREIAGAQRIVERLTGRTPTLFRPPFLATDERVRKAAERQGLDEVLVTEDSRDYAGALAAAIVDASERLEPGGILLMHDWPPATVAAVPGIAASLQDRGLCAGRIAPGGAPVDSPGTDASFRARAVKP